MGVLLVFNVQELAHLSHNFGLEVSSLELQNDR